MFLSGGRIFELLETDSIHFAPVQMQEDPLFRNTFKRINRWEKNRLVFSGNDLLFFFDSKTLKTSKPIRVPFITAAVKSGTDEAIVTTSGKDRLCKISLASGKIIKRYPDLKDQYDKAMHPSPESIYHLQDQWFFITSPTAGVYVFDAKHETLKRYMHNPVDNNKIGRAHV